MHFKRNEENALTPHGCIVCNRSGQRRFALSGAAENQIERPAAHPTNGRIQVVYAGRDDE